ncbi:GSCFA domain-containing protein [Dyella solisilvae]|uniref:GSCFA domain-containing protein n=2 Tax=Dyella solisilvae TaxID=1920168 RepID=A0A370K7U6_9GAMM|nr:GSCFA domain-containing protein [Dyella solisilvae]
MAERSVMEIDPVSPPAFRIGPQTRVVTAGSCFAQHLSRYLQKFGFGCFETEPAHPLLDGALATAFNYGVYSARYGNIYTSRQLLQLWRRACGVFMPADDVWQGEDGWYDPFRPTIQPGGFSSLREFEEDRRQHFAAVRRAFGEADVLVFTLGLTECWAAREDGAVYPLCPGVAAGRFDAARHQLLELEVADVVADVMTFVEEVRRVNPRLKLMLTVSPIPLAATAREEHVLTATTHAKAILRVAAQQLTRLQGVYYFPAFEIVQVGGAAFFASDRRSVNEQGVQRVMCLFHKHMLEVATVTSPARAQDDFLRRGQAVVDTMCDEQRLDAAGSE